MLEQYAWTLWFIVPLSLPVLGLVYLAACALADRETGFLPSIGLGSATFYASLGVGWVLMTQLGKQETRPEVSFGPLHLAGAALGLLASWGLGFVAYAAAY